MPPANQGNPGLIFSESARSIDKPGVSSQLAFQNLPARSRVCSLAVAVSGQEAKPYWSLLLIALEATELVTVHNQTIYPDFVYQQLSGAEFIAPVNHAAGGQLIFQTYAGCIP